MEKDKKYNIVLGLMIFFFLIIVGGCVAFGLGIVGFNSAEKNNNSNNSELINDTNNNVNNMDNNNSLKEENNNESITNNTQDKEHIPTISIEKIENSNKESSSIYLSVIAAGSPEGRVQKIMNYASYEEMQNHYTNTVVEEMYKVTDIDYSEFTSRIPALSQQLLDDVYLFVMSDVQIFKDYNGKLAIYQGSWTGIDYEFVSQKLVSSSESNYNWEVIVKRTYFNGNSEELTCQVQGKVENNKYVLISFIGI